MKNIQFPNAYSKDHTHYVYYADDGTKFRLVAGENGVTEAWIAQLKKLHQEELNAGNRLMRKRWNGETYARTAFRLDEVSPDVLEYSLSLLDLQTEGETAFIRAEERAEFWQRFQRAWGLLEPRQRDLFIKVRVLRIPQTEIARLEGVTKAAISSRMATVVKKLQASMRQP